MRPLLRAPVWLACAILAALPAAATPTAANPAGIALHLLAFPRSADTTRVELLVGDRAIEVELASNRLTGPYTVPAQQRWVFGRRGEGADGKPRFESWGAGATAGTSTQLVILFRTGAANADGFRVAAYDAGPAAFGDRQLLFLNLTSLPVAGEVGGERFTLDPARHRVLTPAPDQGGSLCHARLLFYRDDRWRPFFTSHWPIKAGTRGLILIHPDPVTSRIRLHTIRDVL